MDTAATILDEPMAADVCKEAVREWVSLANDEERWLSVMRFGLATLLGDQPFLVDLICERAERDTLAELPESGAVTVRVAELMAKLGLKLTTE